jgi:hypothetical protein
MEVNVPVIEEYGMVLLENIHKKEQVVDRSKGKPDSCLYAYYIMPRF